MVTADTFRLFFGLINHSDGDFAGGIVDRNCATLCGIAVRIELAAVAASFLRSALSGVQADHVVPRTHWLAGFVPSGVDGLQDAGLLGFAVRAREIILAVGVDDAALGVVEKFCCLNTAIIVQVNFFRPV